MSRYEEAGVHIRAGEEVVSRIRELCRSTFGPQVVSDVGGFAGVVRVPGAPGLALLSSIDGVGTKLKIAFLCRRHDTVGYDLVCHSANDILVHGATPLFFLDYIATSALDPATVEAIVAGLARGCREVGCALVGGETAEMPGFYAPGEYDLAGAIVGIAAEAALLDGSRIEPGDALVGLPSAGLHTNGYSLARKILFETLGLGVSDRFPDATITVGEELLKPHRYYGPAVAVARGAGEVRGMAHVTGGGIPGNLVRVLPEGVGAEVSRGAWVVPPVFRVLAEAGRVAEAEAYEVWNMGIGLVLVVRGADGDPVVRALAAAGHEPRSLGRVRAGRREVRLIP
jgi:phosphoribosylformylglycinamidine cyclo-ligase